LSLLRFYKVVTVTDHSFYLFIRHICAKNDGIPMLLIHMISRCHTGKRLPKKVRFKRVAFQVDAEFTVYTENMSETFFIYTMTNNTPTLAKRIVLVSGGEC